MSALLLHATSSAAATCSVIEENTDYAGNDIKQTTRSSAANCCADCGNTPGCTVYSWEPFGSSGKCFLKSKPSNKEVLWGSRAAKLVLPTATCSTIQENTDLPGNDIGDPLQLDTVGLCCSFCAYTKGCVAYVWVLRNNVGTCLPAKISAQVHRELLVEGVVQEVVVNFVPVNLDSMVLLDASGAYRSGLVDALIAQSKKAKRVVDNVLGIRINGHCDKFFYIDNTFFPCGSLTTNEIRALANSPSVQSISKAVVARVNPLKVTAFESDAAAAAANQWGVDKIQASAVWATNATGTGIVVANIDTGVRLTHEAVSSNWRSDFGWFDPDAGSTTPSDSNGHGTHVMGTIAGQVNGIGVAPGAKWIACLGCPNSSCPQATLTACAQWLLCPTDALGNKDCTKAPHVINNSWGSTDGASTWFEPSISAWRAAGIIPVFSNGNSGNDCGTVGSPGMSPQVIAVGATDSTDGLAYFSSRGPTYDNRIKPDLSAPGVNIVSAYSATDTTYAYINLKHQLLFQTNKIRAVHSIGSVTWNDGLAIQMQAWADTCPGFQHGGPSGWQNLATYDRCGFQECMAIAGAAWLWYDQEETLWNYDTNQCSTGAWADCGHFSNMMSPQVSSMACGWSECGNGNYVWCNYVTPVMYPQVPLSTISKEQLAASLVG
ncbi:hypothetical protein DYB37_005577 [Aphanomyces astaci]|uniref:subtilisin n=1 Tax=Aphanomyces astaci TaxID=112090 RepID=A0A3R7FC57_APHAT|nr:hypothetical protein DYB37_005577 [Aphanomyces astaci]